MKILCCILLIPAAIYSNAQKTDLQEMNLKGRVKTFTELGIEKTVAGYQLVPVKIIDFDKSGFITSIKFPRDNAATILTYDSLHRLNTKISSRLNSKDSTILTNYYDDLKRLSKSVVIETGKSPPGFIRTYSYDSTGREIKLVFTDLSGKYAGSEQTTYSLDSIIHHTYNKDVPMRTSIDIINKQGWIIEQLIERVENKYMWRIIKSYDQFGKVIKEISYDFTGDAYESSYRYDSLGNRLEMISRFGAANANQVLFKYQYFFDDSGNVTRQDKTKNGMKEESKQYRIQYY
jgi:hypothetical protein